MSSGTKKVSLRQPRKSRVIHPFLPLRGKAWHTNRRNTEAFHASLFSRRSFQRSGTQRLGILGSVTRYRYDRVSTWYRSPDHLRLAWGDGGRNRREGYQTYL